MLASLQRYDHHKYHYAMFLVMFFNGTGITNFNTSDACLVILSAACVGYIYFIMNSSIDMVFFYVLAYWVAVNYISITFSETNTIKASTFVGSVLKLFIGYAFIKISRENLLVWFERTVYLLAIISIPFYILQLTYQPFFEAMPINFAEAGRLADGHWNGLIYNYTTYHLSQNSGFAGEPGTFGYYVGFAMIFNLILNQGKPNKVFYILMIIGMTSISTTYYITLMLFGGYFIMRSSIFAKSMLLVVAIPAVGFVFSLPFMGDKIDEYVEQSEDFSNSRVVKSQRINRLAMFIKDINNLMELPTGYGLNQSGLSKNIYGQVITGTNGISRIAVRYGFFGFVFFMVVYIRLYRKVSLGLPYSGILAMITFMYIGANPMERDFYAMGLFWLYFLGDEERIRKLIAQYKQSVQPNQIGNGI